MKNIHLILTTVHPSLSFSDSVVILERWGDFYNVSFDSADISSMTLSLHQLDRKSITLQSDSLRLDFCRICVYKEMSSYHPYPSFLPPHPSSSQPIPSPSLKLPSDQKKSPHPTPLTLELVII